MQQIHYTKLPSSRYFTPTDLKHLLPIHHQSSLQNLRTIFTNFAQSNYPKNIILLPDQNLELGDQSSIRYYSYLKAVWCEDFQKGSSGDFLRNCLGFGCCLVNYVGSIDQDSPIQESGGDGDGYVSRIDVVTLTPNQTVEKPPKKYQSLPQKKTSIGFKFQKTSSKIYMLLGVNIKTRQSLPLSCAILRQWNINRLKLTHSTQGIDIDLIHRICQHLFCLCRGFVRTVADDYNTFHANLVGFLGEVGGNGLEDRRKVFEKYRELKLNSGNLPQQSTILNCQIILSKSITQQNLWQLVSELVTEWLLQTPINASCSYASYVEQETTDKFKIVLASHYQASNRNVYGGIEELLKGTGLVQALLFDQVYKREEGEANPIKASLMLLNKYQGSAQKVDKNEFMLKRQPTPPEPTNPLNQSLLSQISNSSQSQSQSQSRSKTSLKSLAKLQNQIFQILKHLDLHKKILTPTQIENTIRCYVKWLLRIESSNAGVTEQEYEVLRVLRAVNQELTAQEVYLLVGKGMGMGEVGLVVGFLMERGRYGRAVQVGKMIADQHLETLYKESLKYRQTISKHNILTYYLKKLSQTFSPYHPNPPPPPTPPTVPQLSIPQLLQTITQKSYSSHFYSSILTTLFPQLFPQFEPIIKILSPLLAYFVDCLLRLDHHQELVMGFLGDLVYQVCYFWEDCAGVFLSNSVYMGDGAKGYSIKEKKILEMVREGGFKGFGYEVKTHLMPIILSNKSFTEPQQILYHLTKIQKPTQLHHFFKLLSSCHHTETINKIAKYLQYKNQYVNVLGKAAPLVCYFLCGDGENGKEGKDGEKVRFKVEGGKEEVGVVGVQENEFSSIAERILRSESGIFQDMVRLNPNLKIAGIQLKSAIKTLSTSHQSPQKPPKKGQISEQQAVNLYITPKTFQNYEYVQLALSCKQRYLNYHTLSEIEKSYFRDCATTAVQHREEIYGYVGVSQKMKVLQAVIGAV